MIRLRFIKPKEVTIGVKREAVIGRENFNVVVRVDNSLMYDIGSDTTVSRNHARIYFENGRWYVQDLGSLNGTRVDNEFIISKNRSMSKPIEVRNGSEIEIGEETLFKVEFEYLELEYCEFLKQIRNYVNMAIDYLIKAREQRSVSYLKDAFKILSEKLNEEPIREVIKKISSEKSEKILHHISIITSIKQIEDYIHSSKMLMSLTENLESLRSDIEKELKNCAAARDTII